MKRLAILGLLIATGSAAEVRQLEGGIVQEVRTETRNVSNTTLPVTLYLTYSVGPVSHMYIDVLASSTFVTVDAVGLDGSTMNTGPSIITAQYPTPATHSVNQYLKQGTHYINIAWTDSGNNVTGVEYVPFVVDYGLQPLWQVFPTSHVETVETSIYQQAEPLGAYLLTAALFAFGIWWVANRIKWAGRTV